MDDGLLTPQELVLVTTVLTFVGYIINDLVDWGLERQQSGRTREKNFIFLIGWYKVIRQNSFVYYLHDLCDLI